MLASAARAVSEVARRGRSADDALEPFAQSQERGAIRAVTLGALRWYLRLLPAVTALLSTERPLDPAVRSLLVVAAHQVEYSRNAPQATVHAAVDAARILGQARASGLVNAVMRRFVSERAGLLAAADADRASAAAHPRWLVERIDDAWPAEAAAVLHGNNEHPPLVLRVDRSRSSVDACLAGLAAAGCPGRALGWAPAAIEIERPVPVARVPGFREGLVSVQDAGAQLAAPLLGAEPGMRVLDACAAPGGKTLHLLEHTPDLGELIAIDADPARLKRIEENLERAGRSARLAVLDARSIGTTPFGARPFDRILVDAPCSATGVIRRHPDIKLLRRAADIEAFAAVQLEILRALFAVLAPAGRLLYCTCSVLPAENDRVIAAFLASEPRAAVAPLPPAAALAPGARDCALGVQLLPGMAAQTDGFYYACLEKATAGN